MSQQYYQTQDANVPSQQQEVQQSKPARPGVHESRATKSRDWESDIVAGSSSSGTRNMRGDASYVSPAIASSVMRRFLAARVREEGFERAENAALVRLEVEVVSFIEQIFSRAKAFADIAARGRPTAPDVLAAAQEYDLDVPARAQEDKDSVKRARKRKRSDATGEPERSLNLELVLPERRSTSPELLASDDENTPPVVPQTLRSLPVHLPPLPPKHTYLRTPVPPPKKQALPSLEKKLENAALVQESLRSLLLATEVDADANDGELFGGVVNWEGTRHPRKKWKIGN